MKNPVIIHTDGGARGNPGPAAVGVWIVDAENNCLARFGKTIGIATNNVAEYQAVITALEWLKNFVGFKVEEAKFYLDSQLVVNQLNGVFKIKEEHLRKMIQKINLLKQSMGISLTFEYIPREQNRVADSLVNQALDTSIN